MSAKVSARDLDDVTIVIVGASGDLAKRKVLPSIWEIYKDKLIQQDKMRIVGYARTEMTDEEFVGKFKQNLTVSSAAESSSSPAHDGNGAAPKKRTASSARSETEILEKFVSKCHYVSGQYDSHEDYVRLGQELDALEEKEQPGAASRNRLLYLSVPPDVFLTAAKMFGQHCKSKSGWTRVVVEKPYGHDLESFEALSNGLLETYREDEIYYIDHYVGKEVVQNLLSLRFANVIFDPLWTRDNIKCIQVIFKEQLGVEGRGGYFDHYGIIRDIMQNHLMQVLALLCMEPPVSLATEDIRAEKIKVFKSTSPIEREDIVIGQYTAKKIGDKYIPGYTEDPTVADDSLTPTFAAAVLKIKNRRWDGVPILMKAGKALDEKKAEIRIQFKPVPANLYAETSRVYPNELVIRIQPQESIYFKIMSKLPGYESRLTENILDFSYGKVGSKIPEAYSRLLLNVLEGEESNFVSSEEMRQTWRIWDPIIKHLEKNRVPPERYPALTTRGPVQAEYLSAKYQCQWLDSQ